MDFSLSAEQREIQALARELAAAEIEPNAADWDREHRIPGDLYAKLAKVGLMGVCIPEEYGGGRAGLLSHILLLPELSPAAPRGRRGGGRRTHAPTPPPPPFRAG